MSKNRSNDIKRRIHRRRHVKAVKKRLHFQEVKQQMRNNEQIETASLHQSKEHERVSRSN